MADLDDYLCQSCQIVGRRKVAFDGTYPCTVLSERLVLVEERNDGLSENVALLVPSF